MVKKTEKVVYQKTTHMGRIEMEQVAVGSPRGGPDQHSLCKILDDIFEGRP